MTGQVDFYVLNGTANPQRWHYACRLVEKAYLRGMRVAVLGDSAEELRALDELLWTFSDQSFVPHAVCAADAPADKASPVQLMHVLPSGEEFADLVVNLAAQVPASAARCTRIAEILDADPERRRLGRERFKAYRELQLTLKTHQIDE